MRSKAGLLFLFLLISCSGVSQVPSTDSNKPLAVRQSENGIKIVRKSFRAMGGLEHLRLIGAKLAISSTVVAEGKSFPVEITLGGPNRWYLNYVTEELKYIYVNENCTKVAYGTPASCTQDEAAWMEPTRILNGLLFPAGDAANLKAVYRLLGEETIGGQVCDIVEIKSQKTNLRLHAMYSRQTDLLVRATFNLIHKTEAKENKTTWTINVSDWREMNGIRVPFMRTILRDDKVVWSEISASIDAESYYERVFNLPVSPITSQPLTGTIPARRVVRIEIRGRMVEIPAPYPTIGGGPYIQGAEATSLPPVENALFMTVKSNLSDIPALEKKLTSAAAFRKSGASEKTNIILLEDAMASEDPVLMIIYLQQ